jgi:hypothetical protein
VRVLLLIACACAVPPAEVTRASDRLVLHGVTVSAWRGEKQTLKARAALLEYGAGSFEAPAGGELTLPDGCRATSASPTHFDGTQARVDGPVTVEGCGVTVSAARATFSFSDGKAVLEGPVHTRIEARK